MKQKTACGYGRFSTDLQNDRSIGDQNLLHDDIAERNNLKIIHRIADYAKSGATLDRDGIRELLHKIKTRQFDVLIVESLTRLARDEGDLFNLWKRMENKDIEIITTDGKVTQLHVLMMGYFGAEFRRQLAIHVRRHHTAYAKQGKIAGAVPYGYRIVEGKPGEPEIDPEQAKTVILIFELYAKGWSPRKIARHLTDRGIPCSSRRRKSGDIAWNFQALVGGGFARRGMLFNRLYVGELIWNQTRSTINPDTLKRSKRPAKADDKPTITKVPHLRIISDELWEAVQARHDGRRRADRRPGTIIPRRDHLLAGMLRCGVCNGMMRFANSHSFCCYTADSKGTCNHTKSYNQKLLVAGLSAKLAEFTADPKRIARAVGELKSKFRTLAAGTKKDSLQQARDRLNRAQAGIDRVVGLILREVITEQEAAAELVKLRSEKATFEERVRLIEGERNVVDLHPAGIKTFQAALAELNAVLRDPAHPRFQEIFRSVVDTVVIHPTPKRAPYEVSPFVRWGALIGGIRIEPKRYTARQVLVEEGVSAKSTKAGPSTPTSRNRLSQIIAIGRWKLAA